MIVVLFVYSLKGTQAVLSLEFELILFSISIKSTPSVIAIFGVNS
jgi:hypothetical protein